MNKNWWVADYTPSPWLSLDPHDSNSNDFTSVKMSTPEKGTKSNYGSTISSGNHRGTSSYYGPSGYHDSHTSNKRKSLLLFTPHRGTTSSPRYKDNYNHVYSDSSKKGDFTSHSDLDGKIIYNVHLGIIPIHYMKAQN